MVLYPTSHPYLRILCRDHLPNLLLNGNLVVTDVILLFSFRDQDCGLRWENLQNEGKKKTAGRH